MSLQGDWEKILAFFKRTTPELKEAKREAIGKGSRQVKGILVRRLKTKQVPGPALDPATVKQKKRNHQDPRKLIATGGMLESIAIHKVDKNTAFIGPSEEYAEVSLYLEFGTENMPARPYVKASLRELEKRMPGIIKEAGFEYTGKDTKG